MAGTWVCRTTFMHNATGGVNLVSVPPVIGCTCLGPASGTVKIPFAADGFVFLDGASVGTPLASLPAGFTPDSVFAFNHTTVISTAGDSAAYTLPLLAPQVVTVTALNPTGTFLAVPLTGMGALSVFASADISVAITSVPAGEVVIQNVGNTGVWNSPAFDVSFSGTYSTTAVPVTPFMAPTTGPVAGGTTVAITGSGFTAATSVTVDGVSVPFTLVSDTRLTFVTPAHAVGDVTVSVVGATFSGTFTYALVSQFGDLPPIPRLR